MTFKHCIQCGGFLKDRHGRPTNQVYDLDLYKKSSIIKLLSCSVCDRIGDKYAEYEGTLILLDLLLFHPDAYRHVIFNEPSYRSLIFKMTLLTVIVDGYASWLHYSSSGGEFFEQEHNFYIMCSKTALAIASYLSIITISFLGFFKNDIAQGFNLLLTGGLLAYSVRFGNLMALLWANESLSSGSDYMWTFVNLQFLGATIIINQVITNRKLASLGVSLISFMSFFFVLKLDSFLFLN